MVRIKHRYLLLNLLYPDAKANQPGNFSRSENDVPWVVQFRQPSSDAIDARLLTRIIRDHVTELFGDYGAGMISGSLQVKYLSTATSVAIVRVARSQYRLVWAALTCTTRIANQACVIQVVRVSGTIKKAEEEAIRRARSMILLARRSASTSSLNITKSTITNTKGQGQVTAHDIEDQMTETLQDPVDPSDSDGSEDG